MHRRKFLAALGGSAALPYTSISWPSALPALATGGDISFAAARLERAFEFYRGLDLHHEERLADFLYHSGIVTHLGLTAYLIEQGVTDDWCRQNIRLDVRKALWLANSLDLGIHCQRTSHLAQILSPYGKWRRPIAVDLPKPGRLDRAHATSDIKQLLEHVHGRLA